LPLKCFKSKRKFLKLLFFPVTINYQQQFIKTIICLD